jgi:site-specific DNA-methyltransferase (adenine-specific)
MADDQDWTNKLYYGDNLSVLEEHIPEESIDLVYLDPPFKSDRDYNVLFETVDGTRAPAQIQAFEDTWRWDQQAAHTYRQTIRNEPGDVADTLQAFRDMIGESDMLAYLSMMAPRLLKLRESLKETGSIFLHCDTAASHYLKLLMDAVFGPDNFRNEIVWRNYGAKNPDRIFGSIHQSIFFYSKTDDYYFEKIYRPYNRSYLEDKFDDVDDEGRPYYTRTGNVLTGKGVRHGSSGDEWRGVNPTEKDRHWAVPQRLKDKLDEDIEDLPAPKQLEKIYQAGHIVIKSNAYWPHPKVYPEDVEDGTQIPDIWAYQPGTEGVLYGTDEGIDADVSWIAPTDTERLGYPTQKPVGLLDRIIKAACPEDGIVLDPFCGCGTTVVSAEKQDRKWIGIDVTHIAVSLVRRRLNDSFDDPDFETIGEPESVQGAKELAEEDRMEFERWAVDFIGAESRKGEGGGDQGIDGLIYFFDDATGQAKQIIVSVKSGENIGPRDVRDLNGVVDREDAEIGVLITLEEPTAGMKTEAASQGAYHSPYTQKDYPKIQIMTVEDMMNGKEVEMPPREQVDHTFKEAPNEESVDVPKQGEL